MAKPKKSVADSVVAQSALYYNVHSLLETIRLIKRYEDSLCVLFHALQSNTDSEDGVRRDLLHLLDDMPSTAYTSELDAIRATLDTDHAASEPAVGSKVEGTAGKRVRKRLVSPAVS